MAIPSQDVEDVILAARYGDETSLADLTAFVENFGADALADAADEYGNTALHMSAANGHKDLVAFLIEKLPARALAATNQVGNTALHWAALNAQLDVLRLIAPHLSPEQIALPNKAGKTAMDVAEERATEISLECAGYLEGQLPETEEEKEYQRQCAEEAKAGVEDEQADVEDVQEGVERLAMGAGAGEPAAAEDDASSSS